MTWVSPAFIGFKPFTRVDRLRPLEACRLEVFELLLSFTEKEENFLAHLMKDIFGKCKLLDRQQGRNQSLRLSAGMAETLFTVSISIRRYLASKTKMKYITKPEEYFISLLWRCRTLFHLAASSDSFNWCTEGCRKLFNTGPKKECPVIYWCSLFLDLLQKCNKISNKCVVLEKISLFHKT